MASIRQLYVALTLRAESYNNAMRQAQRETREFERMIRPTMKTVEDLGKTMRTVGIGLTAALTAPIAAVAGLGIQFNDMQERAQIAFTTMLKDGKRAREFLEDMKNFAAKTPFEFPDLVRASQRLLAMGFAANEIKPLLTTVGDAAAGLGGSAEAIDRITLALGQMQGRGRVATQEMNQLTEVGIPAWRMLAEGMGVSEIKLRDMVEKGLVPAGRSIEILVKALNQAFGGQMEKQAQTFSGLLSTIKDEASFLAADLTIGLFNLLKGPLRQAADVLGHINKTIRGMSDESKTFLALTAGGLAVIGPALIGVSLTLTAINGTIKAIAGLRLALFATIEVLSGVGTIRSLAEARIAMGLYAQSILAVNGAWIAAAAAIGAYLLLAYELFKLGNAYADLVQAEQDLKTANKELETSTKTLEERLRAQGVTVDRGTKSLIEYNEALQKAGRQKWENPMAGLIQQQMAAVEADNVARERKRQEDAAARARAVEKEREAIQRLIDSFRDSLKPADDLNKQLDVLVATFGKEAVVAVWGNRINEAATAQQNFGFAVKGTVSELDAMYLRMQSIKALEDGMGDIRRENASALTSGLGNLQFAKPGFGKAPQMDAKTEIDFLSSLQLEAGYAAMKVDTLNAMLAKLDSVKSAAVIPPAFTETTIRARSAMASASIQAAELGKSIKELASLGYDSSEMIAMLGGELATAANNAEQFGTQLDEQTQGLVYQMEATERAAQEAKRWEQVWTQVLANITTEFARGITDIIFRAKSLVKSMADIGKSVGRAFIEAFFAELFSPMTNMLASWGRQLAGTLQSAVFPKIASAIGLGALMPKVAGAAASTAAGAGGAAAAGGGAAAGGSAFGISGAALGAFFTNPITIGVGAAIGGVLLAKSLIGRGREQADKFVQGVENPFGRDLGSLLQQFHSQQSAGTLTLATATAFRDDAAALIRQYNSTAAEFAAQGKNQAKVVEQSMAGMRANFGDNFSRVFDELNGAIAGLKTSPAGSGIAETGRSLSASNIFSDAVDRFVAGLDKAPRTTQGVTVNYTEGDMQVTITGTDKSTQEIAEELNEVYRTNRRGVLEELNRLLESAGASVATA